MVPFPPGGWGNARCLTKYLIQATAVQQTALPANFLQTGRRVLQKQFLRPADPLLNQIGVGRFTSNLPEAPLQGYI